MALDFNSINTGALSGVDPSLSNLPALQNGIQYQPYSSGTSPTDIRNNIAAQQANAQLANAWGVGVTQNNGTMALPGQQAAGSAYSGVNVSTPGWSTSVDMSGLTPIAMNGLQSSLQMDPTQSKEAFMSQVNSYLKDLGGGGTSGSAPANSGTAPSGASQYPYGFVGQPQAFYGAPGAPGAPNSGYAPAAQVNLQGYTQNPNLTGMVNGIRTEFNNNLNQNTLPALRQGAVAVGGVGGSREGIAQGLAAAQSNVGADNAIANRYGQDYNNQMNRNLQQYQADQQFGLGNANLGLGYAGQANQYDIARRSSDLGYLNANNAYNLGQGSLALGNLNANNSYNLGVGNLGLGYLNANNNYSLGQQSAALQNQGQQMNFNTQQRGLDQSGAMLGANLYQMGTQGQFAPLNSANNLYSQYTGFGNTTGTTSAGGGANGFIGGAIAGGQLANNLGFGTQPVTSSDPAFQNFLNTSSFFPATA